MSISWLDRLGAVASLTCALHCALFAFAPALVALLGLELLADEVFEWGFVLLAVAFAAVAALLGFRTHRSGSVAAGFALGAALLLLARFGEATTAFEGGAVVAVLGGVVLVCSHIGNTQRTRACREACAT